MRLKKSTILVLAAFLVLSYFSHNSNSMSLDVRSSSLGKEVLSHCVKN